MQSFGFDIMETDDGPFGFVAGHEFTQFEGCEGQVVYANELLESPSSDPEESECATEANEHLPQEIWQRQ